MESTSASPQAQGNPSQTTRLGRFTVTRSLGRAGGVEFTRASDADGKTVELAAIDPAVGGNVDLAASLASMRGHGIEGLSEPIGVEGALLISAALPGGPLSALLERKRSTGASGFAPRAAANLIGRLCTIVGAMHAKGFVHGAISPTTVRVDKAGNVHLAGLGLAPLAPAATQGEPTAQMAPELGGGATASSDLFAVGAVLYEVLVGNSPARGCARPSEVIAELSADVDRVIAAAMHPKVERRPPNAEALQKVLTVALTAVASGQVSAQRSTAPSLAESLTEIPAAQNGAQAAPVATALAADDEAWLVSKDMLDYGPFSMSIVFEMIRKDEILPGHIIINKHTGERAPVEEHPLLAELVDEAKSARDERRRADAEVNHSKSEKRRGFALYGFIAAAVLALGLGAYVIVSKVSADKKVKSASIGSLEEGEVAEAVISFPKPDKTRKSGRKGSSKGKRSNGRTSGGGGGANQGGWDDAVDFGDASKSGGDEILDSSRINPVVQGAGGRLGGCLRKNGGGTAAIRFIVKGTGRVSYVAVNGKTNTGLAKCIGSVMRRLKFPTYDGTRTRANFTMSL